VSIREVCIAAAFISRLLDEMRAGCRTWTLSS